MKVSIYETIDISDDQRVALAQQIDGEEARSRQATRAEIKAFAWEHGQDWADQLPALDLPDPDDDTDLI